MSRSDSLNFLESAFCSAALMLSVDCSQLMTLSAIIRPFSRSPISTVGTLKVGVSITPLDEFPATASTYLKVLI